jgi:hypothetical protein
MWGCSQTYTEETLEERDPQAVIPRDLHKILVERHRETGVSVRRLVADALRVGMKVKQWLPEEATN